MFFRKIQKRQRWKLRIPPVLLFPLEVTIVPSSWCVLLWIFFFYPLSIYYPKKAHMQKYGVPWLPSGLGPGVVIAVTQVWSLACGTPTCHGCSQKKKNSSYCSLPLAFNFFYLGKFQISMIHFQGKRALQISMYNHPASTIINLTYFT